jgi:flagellar basal body-associated protein FliL
MSKLKIPIIAVAVLAVAYAGLTMTGMLGGEDKAAAAKKHMVEPVPLKPEQDFTVLLKDTDSARYAVLGVAVQLEPMDQVHYDAFTGAGGGGHGGGGEAPGPPKVAEYPKFANAIVDAAGTFSASELKSPEGKEQLKDLLRQKFAEIAEQDATDYKSDDPHHVGPPYHVMDVYFTKYIVD